VACREQARDVGQGGGPAQIADDGNDEVAPFGERTNWKSSSEARKFRR
jgi:hypothetical protein